MNQYVLVLHTTRNGTEIHPIVGPDPERAISLYRDAPGPKSIAKSYLLFCDGLMVQAGGWPQGYVAND